MYVYNIILLSITVQKLLQENYTYSHTLQINIILKVTNNLDSICTQVSMYVRMYVLCICVYVCMYVGVYVCM